MEYDWDARKRTANRPKHGVDFAVVEQFDWENAIVADDRHRDYGEQRRIAIGRIGTRVCVLVFTQRGNVIRVIGLRKANPRVIKRDQTLSRSAKPEQVRQTDWDAIDIPELDAKTSPACARRAMPCLKWLRPIAAAAGDRRKKTPRSR